MVPRRKEQEMKTTVLLKKNLRVGALDVNVEAVKFEAGYVACGMHVYDAAEGWVVNDYLSIGEVEALIAALQDVANKMKGV